MKRCCLLGDLLKSFLSRTPLEDSNNCINPDSHQRDRFHHRSIQFSAFVVFISGFATCFYGVFNLKLGKGNWIGVVAIPIGIIIASLVSLCSYCATQQSEFTTDVPQLSEEKIERFL